MRHDSTIGEAMASELILDGFAAEHLHALRERPAADGGHSMVAEMGALSCSPV